jgi:hypothetical protein
VDWSNQTPTLGGTALVRVVVQHKDNALLVPASAVHSLGTRKTVDVMVGTERRSVTVDTGIVGDKQIEVLDGLTDGQQILSGLSVVSPSASASPDASSIAAAPTIASALTPTPAQIAPAQVAPAQLAAARPTAPIASGASAPGATALPAGSDATTDTVRQPLFEDHFTDSLQGWSDKTAIGAWIQPDGYHLEPRSAGQFLAVGAPISSVPSDVEVTARLHKSGGPSGGGYGIIVRDQEPLSGVHSQTGAFYVLEVGDGGDVGIWRRDGDHWAELMPWTHSDAVQPGSASNELTARAVGQQLTFLVNGQVVATRQDATLPTGRVGLFVGGDGNQVIAEQFIVRPI